MRVLHLVKTAVGATWALRQMRELVKAGIEIHVALPATGHLEAAYREAGVHVHIADVGFSLSHPARTYNALNTLKHLVESIQPDIVHSHFVSTTLIMRLALRGMSIPCIFQVPGPLHLEHPFFKRAEIALSTPDDYWIGSCHWTQNTYINSGIPAKRVFMSFYGTDLPAQIPPKGKLRRELGLSEDSFIVGMVAYMYAPKRYLGQKRGLKGHEDLINALAICRAQGLPVKGVFVGGAWNNATWYENQMRAYGAEQLGQDAIFLGTRQDIFELYPDFDLAVHPSHSENLGGAVESLAISVPTIATQVGGFPDVVIEGETGWLVPAKDPKTLAQVIRQVLEMPEESRRVAQQGQQLIYKELDVSYTASQIAEIYHTITAKTIYPDAYETRG